MRRARHTLNPQSFLVLGLIIFSQFNSGTQQARAQTAPLPDAEESHPGIGMESRYAEAVIAYNRKQTQEALKILDELITVAPKSIEYLELKALILKGMNEPRKSLEVYWQLYKASAEQNRGPYAFELATLLDKSNRHNDARAYYKKAIALKFNVAASHLYLGLGSFNSGNYVDAEDSFIVAAGSGIPDLEIVARYYLGLTYFKLNHGSQGIQEIVEARKMATQRGSDDLAKTIGGATEKMLQPFSRGQWFGNLALLTQYDSNVQQLPSGVTNPAAGANPSTLKANVSAGGGYMSAPINPVQWVAGYRGSYNYNFNSATKAFQYFSNNATLFLNYQTLARTSGGIKFEGNYTFQNALTDVLDPASGYTYLKYNSTIGVGPYFRHQLNRAWRFDAELGLRKQSFYIDPNLSGTNFNARVSIRNDAMNLIWNPGFSLVYENNAAQGSQFYYRAYGIGLTNSMNLRGRLTLTQSIDVLASNYLTSSPKRDDKNYSFRIGAAKILGPKWALLADFAYIKNVSTVEASYSYSRLMTSAGVGYTF